MTRTSRLLAVAGVSALALTACTSTVRTGAAAVVGDERITSTRLQQVVDRGVAGAPDHRAPGPDAVAYSRSVLLRLITHDVLVVAARDEHVSVDAGQVDATQDRIATQLGGPQQLQAKAAESGIAPADLRQTLSDITLRDALADRLTADLPVDEAKLRAAYQAGIAGYDRVHSAHILVATKALAVSLLGRAKADPASFAALAATYSTDQGSKDKGGDLGFQGRGALAKQFETAIFTHPPGSFVIARTSFGYHVIHVIERQTASFEQVRPDLRRGLLGQQRLDAVNALLATTARRLGVRVNPRYGRWDATALKVVAATSPVSAPEGGDPAPPPAGTTP